MSLIDLEVIPERGKSISEIEKRQMGPNVANTSG